MACKAIYIPVGRVDPEVPLGQGDQYRHIRPFHL